MIIGIGNDIVEISRIEEMIKEHGDRFIDRCFTEGEQADYQKEVAKLRPAFLAKRFAAKEAFVKALGTGFRNRITMRDICVSNNDYGKPIFTLYGETQKYAESLAREGNLHMHLTLSDDAGCALATVVLEQA